MRYVICLRHLWPEWLAMRMTEKMMLMRAALDQRVRFKRDRASSDAAYHRTKVNVTGRIQAGNIMNTRLILECEVKHSQVILWSSQRHARQRTGKMWLVYRTRQRTKKFTVCYQCNCRPCIFPPEVTRPGSVNKSGDGAQHSNAI
jgi:hypothetical protein